MNKEDIIAILMSNLRPMKETRLAVLEQIADEIMALLAQPVWTQKINSAYDKLSELDSEKFPVRVEERPGGKTIYPVDIACSIHEDDCECRQCRPDMWFQQNDVWTKKI